MNEVEATKQTYNKLAHLWSKTGIDTFFYEKQFRVFCSYLKSGNSVIDIGCANGLHIPLFLGIGSELKLKYEGYDISSSMLKIAKSRYPNLSFKYIDISDSKSLPKKRFNAFWAAAVLLHVPLAQWDEMFINLEKIIKPKGVGFITIPEKTPVTASPYDKRHFTIMKGSEAVSYLRSKKWKILKKGTLMGARETPWNWFVVQLP